MMSTDEKNIVFDMYSRFIKSEENRGWTEIDDNLEFFDWMKDEEIVAESAAKFLIHSEKGITCYKEHNSEECFAQTLVEACGYILKLFEETRFLHTKNRYILVYYITLSEMKLIYPISERVQDES